MRKVKLTPRRRHKYLNIFCGDLDGDYFQLVIPYFDMTTEKKADRIEASIRKELDRILRHYRKKGLAFGKERKVWAKRMGSK
jgi:hypothetical protein